MRTIRPSRRPVGERLKITPTELQNKETAQRRNTTVDEPLDEINLPGPYHAFVAYLTMLESGENMSIEKRATLRKLHAKFLQICRRPIDESEDPPPYWIQT